MIEKIQFRRDTSSNWSSLNITLAEGEIGIECNTGLIKIGNGLTAWNELQYINSEVNSLPSGIDGSVQIYGSDNKFSSEEDLNFNEEKNYFQPGNIIRIEPSIQVEKNENLILYAKDFLGRTVLHQIDKYGIETPLQNSLATKNIVSVFPLTGTSITSFGCSSTTTGTISHPVLSFNSRFESFYGFRATSATTAGASCGILSPDSLVWRGDNPGVGGFIYSFLFSFNVNRVFLNQSRLFVGLCETTSVFGNSEPSSFLDLIGIGNDSSDDFLSIIHNDSSGTATKIPLGDMFLAKPSNPPFLNLTLSCKPNDDSIKWRIVDLHSRAEASGEALSKIPSKGTFLTHQLWANRASSSVASAATIDVIHVYGESSL
jgi:hypothetical protein